MYWDKDGGCLQGSWSKGVLTGKATFDQLAHSFQVGELLLSKLCRLS